MKKTNKIFSVILALALVFAMTIPAFAAGEGKITITNAVAEQTYTIYKMLTFEPGQSENTGVYKVATGWEAFFTGEGKGLTYFDVSATDGTVTIKEDAKEDAAVAALAKDAIAYATAADSTATAAGSETATEDGPIVFENLELGYYAVDTSLGTICSLDTTNNEVEITEKNSEPTITKKVQEDSDSTWGATNDADIGDTVNFKTTVTAKAGATKYVVHDTMEDGLTLAGTIAIEGLTSETDYTVATECQDGCDFEITFTQAYLDKITAATDIVITYSAVLNKDAEIVTNTNDNTTWLTYGDNATSTEESTTKTLTYYFDLTKTDGTTQLDGAEFTLTNAAGKTMTFVKVDGGYRVATSEDTDTTTTIVAGKVTITGLDADTYSLKETKAPEGYNLLEEETEVVVTAATVGEEVTFTPNDVKVVNKTGDLLPDTGGIGTTIFYIVGALLVVGAVVILISKRRTSAEA